VSLAPSSGAALDDGLALFHRTLAELCRSETPLPRAFRIIEAEADTKALARAAGSMAADVEAGTSLSDAYAAHSKTFSPLYAQLVKAGEDSGDLAGALEQIAHHAAHRAAVAARLRGALAYPITTAVFVLLVGAGVLIFATPKLSTFTERVSGNSPLPIALLALGGLAAVVLIALWFSWRQGRTGSGSFRLPILGPLRLTAAKASLASTLALLLRREVPLHEALRKPAGARLAPWRTSPGSTACDSPAVWIASLYSCALPWSWS